MTAAALLAERVGDVLALSDLYETEPWGFESENLFINAVVVLSTTFSPFELLDMTREIEIEMGRKQKSDGAYHDRVIDIDILMMDDIVIESERLNLPHPLMHKRAFVMDPMVEVAPDLIHPLLGRSMRDIWSDL